MRADVELLEREDDDIIEVEGPTELIRVRLIGKTQLLMNSNAGVNPLHPLVKQKNALTAKRPKQRTDEDINEIYRLDFVLGMYYDEEIGPYVPGVNPEAAILQAAKLERLGTQFKAGVSVIEDKIPLNYKGPRTIEALWKKETFADIRPTKLKASSSLMKCRPCFPIGWSLEFTVKFNGAIISDRATVERCIKQIGDIGICDYRKRYGKSTVEIL